MIERRKAKRYPIVLPALCWSRHRKDFYAVTQDISVDGILLKSSTLPGLNEELVVSIPQIGSVEAQVIRREGQSFVIRVLSRSQPVSVVARELVALSHRQDGSYLQDGMAVSSRRDGMAVSHPQDSMAVAGHNAAVQASARRAFPAFESAQKF